MKGRTAFKFATVVAVVTCGLASVAASAFATVSIEPLNDAFTGKGVSESTLWHAAAATWGCGRSSIAGKTNSTKTNYVNVTPTMPECSMAVGADHIPFPYAAQCKTKGTIPWTFTLNEGGKASLKLDCAMTFIGEPSEGVQCTMTMPEQTIEKGVAWKNETGGLALSVASEFAMKASTGCLALLIESGEVDMAATYVLSGIKAT
jgi:hypothetical protein